MKEFELQKKFNWEVLSEPIAENTGGGSSIPVVVSYVSETSITPNFSTDVVSVSAQSTALTIEAPTGTPVPCKSLMLRIKDNGTSRVLTFNSIYRVIDAPLPGATVAGKFVYIGLLYNEIDNKWDVLGVSQQY